MRGREGEKEDKIVYGRNGRVGYMGMRISGKGAHELEKFTVGGGVRRASSHRY